MYKNMAKEKLFLKNEAKFCYSVKENNLKDFYDKIIELSTINTDKDFAIELRIDYLINKKIDIQDIIKCINNAKKFLLDYYNIEKYFIATLRNFTNGGNCLVDDKKYLSIIETLYEKPCVDAIDIDYDFYENKSSSVKKLFAKKKSLIITFTCRDKSLSEQEYDEVIKTLLKSPTNIVKIVTKAFSFDDTEKLMEVAKKYDKLLSDNKKCAIFISTGKIGIISRIWYEYTNTKLIYLENGEYSMIPNGDIDEKLFDKFRKMLFSVDGLKQ